MGKNFVRASKTGLRNVVEGLRKELNEMEVEKRRSFVIIGALLNRNNGLVEFTRHELDEINMDSKMDVLEKPEIDKYILRWEDKDNEQQPSSAAEFILGAKSGASTEQPDTPGL